MNSHDIVEAYKATLVGQQVLFQDDDLILRNTEFKTINRDAVNFVRMHHCYKK